MTTVKLTTGEIFRAREFDHLMIGEAIVEFVLENWHIMQVRSELIAYIILEVEAPKESN